MKTKPMVFCALFAALMAVFSQIAIPLPGLVPINLATLGVFLSGAILGWKYGGLCQIVYLLLGAVGLPVFAGFRGGLQVLAGPTGGYLIGYLLAAVLIGLLLQIKSANWMLPVAMVLGLAACYTLGTAWYVISSETPISVAAAVLACVVPFLPGDALKIITACLIAPRVNIFSAKKEIGM